MGALINWLDHFAAQNKEAKLRLRRKLERRLERERQRTQSVKSKLWQTQLTHDLVYGIQSVIPLKYLSWAALIDNGILQGWAWLCRHMFARKARMFSGARHLKAIPACQTAGRCKSAARRIKSTSIA